MEHTLPPLPYAIDALAPHYSQETLEYTKASTTTPMW
jgi:Fe-Mn family superoxide dismutase